MHTHPVFAGETTLPELEENLTTLAECVFVAVIRELVKINESVFRNMAVLGMGRMAGSEMIFGSDLDLIFLYKSKTGDDTTQISKQVQGLLRHLSTVSPAGLLYEVDTRLRPHGNSGSLVTSVDSFTEYHCSDRAVWERQMMTRCRPIYESGQDRRRGPASRLRRHLRQPRSGGIARRDRQDAQPDRGNF